MATHVQAAITFDAIGTAATNSATSLSWSHTIGAGSDRVLIVFLVGNIVDEGFIGATYNDVILVPVRITNRHIPSGSPAVWLWVLMNPPIGTFTVSVSPFQATRPIIGISASFSGVSQTAQYGANGGTIGSGTSATATVATTAGEVVVATAVNGIPAQTLTVGGGQTEISNLTTPNAFIRASATYSTAESNTWTLGASGPWATAGVSLKPTGASGTPPIPAHSIWESNMTTYGTTNYNTIVTEYNEWQAGTCEGSGSGTITSSGTTLTFSASKTGLLNLYVCAQSQSRLITAGSGTSWTIASSFSPDIGSPTAWTFTDQPSFFATNYDFYDGVEVYRNIRVYTGNASPWQDGSNKCQDAIVRGYYIPNNSGVPGYQHFTRGLYIDFVAQGTANSKTTVESLRDNAAYSTTGNVTSADVAREAAYGLAAHIMAKRLGFSANQSRRDVLVNALYGHFDQWFTTFYWSGTTKQFAPFMVGLAARSLIEDRDETSDVRLIPALTKAADYLWTNAWDAPTQSMKYDINPDSPDLPTPSPDLNLLIAPMYMWLGMQTLDVQYVTKADLLFQGGVVGAGLGNGKQFNQSYTWSFDYLNWRNSYYGVGRAVPVPPIPAADRPPVAARPAVVDRPAVTDRPR